MELSSPPNCASSHFSLLSVLTGPCPKSISHSLPLPTIFSAILSSRVFSALGLHAQLPSAPLSQRLLPSLLAPPQASASALFWSIELKLQRNWSTFLFPPPSWLSRPGFIPEKSLEELELTFSETSFWPGNKPSLSDEHEKAC